MGLKSHQVQPSKLLPSASKKLKQICQSWTRLGDDLYVVHHAESLSDVCPACKIVKELIL